jgi:pimeloyl-ACP methyl ester carboxylesterase
MAEVTPSGSGGPIELTGPATDGSLEIRGGIGGISFQLEELVGGAEKLEAAAGELAAVEVEVRRIWEDLCPYQDDARSTGTAALMDVGEAQRSVQAVRTELTNISRQVRDCKWDYEVAEAIAAFSREHALTGVGTWLQQLQDAGVTGSMNRDATELAVGNIPAAMGVLFGPPAYLAGKVAVEASAAAHVDAATPMLRSLAGLSPRMLEPRPVSVREVESHPVELDASLAGLLERARLVDERGAGYIEVLEVENGGQKAYVVVVPGTQPAGEGMGGENPFDEAGIAEGLGYGSTEVNAAVLQALRAVGAERGAPVATVGYSQGGIHAMNMAADEQFRAEYNVKYVLTAGSPVGNVEADPGISTLHLEHKQDWVPGSDGAASPDTRNRVTVTLTNDVRTPDGEDPGLGPGHKLTNYQDGARLVAASRDPSLVASTAVLGGVLGAGGTATATRFAFTRTKTPEPQGGPAPTPRPRESPRPSEVDRGR